LRAAWRTRFRPRCWAPRDCSYFARVWLSWQASPRTRPGARSRGVWPMRTGIRLLPGAEQSLDVVGRAAFAQRGCWGNARHGPPHGADHRGDSRRHLIPGCCTFRDRGTVGGRDASRSRSGRQRGPALSSGRRPAAESCNRGRHAVAARRSSFSDGAGTSRPLPFGAARSRRSLQIRR